MAQINLDECFQESELEDSVLEPELAEIDVQETVATNDVDNIGPVVNVNLNTTAYRIFKLLLWLNQEPLSVDELNERFYQDPDIRKRLSSDSIWLYVNTLKALGCEIKRPSRSNGFKYELMHHPFGIFLSNDAIGALIAVKSMAEEQLPHMDILAFDRLLKKIVHRSAMADRERRMEDIFRKSRTWNYEALETIIDDLQDALAQKRLLLLTYLSPVRGKETFYYLPDDLIYQNGLLYLVGIQHTRTEPSMLRVERIEHFETVERPDIYSQLCKLQQQDVEVRLRLLLGSADEFEGFGLDETVTMLPAESGGEGVWLDIRLKTREFFFLRQKIMEMGVPFQILSPESFRQEMLSTLRQMSRLYEGDLPHA